MAGTARHNKGCNCKKSGCLKKYCECFQAGIYCGDNCKCIDCKNFEVRSERLMNCKACDSSLDHALRLQLSCISWAAASRLLSVLYIDCHSDAILLLQRPVKTTDCCLGQKLLLILQGSEAREAVALTAFQPQDMGSRHHQPLPHQSPAQNKRQRLAPPHHLHRQPHPPLPAIPVNNRQPLPAIPEMTSRGMHHGPRSRMHHSQASGEFCNLLLPACCSTTCRQLACRLDLHVQRLVTLHHVVKVLCCPQARHRSFPAVGLFAVRGLSDAAEQCTRARLL